MLLAKDEWKMQRDERLCITTQNPHNQVDAKQERKKFYPHIRLNKFSQHVSSLTT